MPSLIYVYVICDIFFKVMASNQEKVPLLNAGTTEGPPRNCLLPCVPSQRANAVCGRCDKDSLCEAYHPKSLFTPKPIDTFIAESKANLKGKRLDRALGLTDLIGYGVGCTVGAGIYSLIGSGAGLAGKLQYNVCVTIFLQKIHSRC